MSADDIIVVLKQSETLHLKAIFQIGDLSVAVAQYVGGEAGATLNVWPVWAQNLIVFGTQYAEAANKLARDGNLNLGSGSVPLRGHVKLNEEVCRGVITVQANETTVSLKGKSVWREGELAFVRKLGTSNLAMLTFVGRRLPRHVHYNCECSVVGEYKRTIPASYSCGTIGHQQDNCPHPDVSRCGYCGQGVRASERIQTHRGSGKKTSKPSGNKGASSGKPGQVNGPAAGNNTSKKNPKTSGQSVKPPALQEGDFPPLANSNAETTYKVSNWAGVASTSSPSPSPLELELKKEIALLRTQNEQLEQKIHSKSGDESASLCSGMGTVTSDPLISNLESRMTALEKSVSDQMAPLPTMLAQIIQAQIREMVSTVTQQITAAVTQSVTSWIQASPKFFRWAGPAKEVGRPSKLDEDKTEYVPLVTALQATVSQPASSAKDGTRNLSEAG
ncbi:hypothetical protein HPB50_006210 [Hyalomma asiaticum]|uniref:Uncharacterized protein n=1 Tax=Hyalomma asiaticum TaxID=266040 RepID=A0ACB7SNK5_HYAAI|nr:hypothetical protein HPB50_006210 [Hyalomma asiaticum]